MDSTGDKDSNTSTNISTLVEDEIDQFMHKMDGKIKRKFNRNLCRHSENALCVHCAPLEPGDPMYLEMSGKPLKFLPFHAYLKKLQNNSKFIYLENLCCDIKSGCTYHPPWPEGICTKCQPIPITLNLQEYRHVDYVQFENPDIMNNFLDYWRKSGSQRIGILFGDYDHHDSLDMNPLAIKCVVKAIFEIEQVGNNKGVRFVNDLNQCIPPHTQEMIREIGLRPVGWIFTDLVTKDLSQGTVKHYRGTIDSYFLSAQECITAAHLQNIFPNISKFSTSGYFGSKFVTVVVTGDENNEIHFEGYQVSNQAMALARSNILVPTQDAPELGYIIETTKEKFVPEVFYSCKDEYGNQVTKIGRPLPMEYLLLDIPVAFPKNSKYSFSSLQHSSETFPIENRENINEIQNISQLIKLKDLLEPKGNKELISKIIGNFHILNWIMSSNLIESASDKSNLYASIKEYIKNGNLNPLEEWTRESPGFLNLQEIMANSASTTMASAMGSDDDQDKWSCTFCTYLNLNSTGNCEMCGLPKS